MSEPAKIVVLSPEELKALIREAVAEAIAVAGNGHPAEDRLLDAEEASAMLGVSPGWLYKRSKTLPFVVKVHSRLLRFSRAGILRYIAAKKLKGGS